MSTGRQIVKDASDLVEAVDDLMQAQTTQKVIDIAKKVKCGSAINSAVDFIDEPLDKVEKLLEEFRDLAAQIAGISGLLGLMQPLFDASVRVVSTPGEQLQRIGLSGSGMESIQDSLALITDGGDRILSGGQTVLDNYPDRVSVEDLISNFKHLRQTIGQFKDDVENGG